MRNAIRKILISVWLLWGLMRYKKGQASIFIIIGIVIIIAGGVFYAANLGKGNTLDALGAREDIKPIEFYMDNCLITTAKSSLPSLGRAGMYYNLPIESLPVIQVDIDPYYERGGFSPSIDVKPFYMIFNDSLVPSMDRILEEMQVRLKEEFLKCMNNSDFWKSGYILELGNITSEVNMSYESIVFRIKNAGKVHKGEAVTELADMSYILDYNFIEKYLIVIMFFYEQTKEPEYMQLGLLTNLAYDNNFTFETYNIGNNVIQYDLVFDDYMPGPFIYSFLVKYDWNLDSYVGNFLRNYNISLNAYIGYEFSYKIETQWENIKFTDYTDLFDITDTGEIRFTPELGDEGVYPILIKMEDNENTDYVYLMLNIMHDNTKPKIEDIPDQTAILNNNFYYKVSVQDTDETVFYLDDTSLFDIDIRTGEINFTPINEGYFKINISVSDLSGETDNEIFYLRVKK